LIGGTGSSVLVGGYGNDIIQGGSNADILIGSQSSDIIAGGRGNDLIIGGTATNENLLAVLQSALVSVGDGNFSDALALLGPIDDQNFDILFGQQGLDVLFGNCGDWLFR
ncbi:MAG: hypothetical protein KDA89_17495, partial [Planctomycetaceae bacterium]|nr:hypothetical protein [Planctomycetaceae bacterium]